MAFSPFEGTPRDTGKLPLSNEHRYNWTVGATTPIVAAARKGSTMRALY
jgi:hypothetical protein